MEGSIILTKQNGIASITLNRPDKFNAFNREMALAMQEALDNSATDDAIRCVVITGNGKAFSAGQDIAELVGDNAISMEKILSEHYNPIVTRMRKMPKPVVCAVNGVAAGAGANIALCGDIVVAAKSATFIQAFSKIGLIPDSGGTYFLPRLVGFAKASALMMLAEKVPADDALQMGMIYKVLNDEEFAEGVQNIAKTLADMPTTALAKIKQALSLSFENNLIEQLDVEDRLQRECAATDDYREGITSFLEKRSPKFSGK